MNPFRFSRRTNPARWKVNVPDRRYVGRCDSCGVRTVKGLGAVHTDGPAVGYRALYCPACVSELRAGRHPGMATNPAAPIKYNGPVRIRLFRPSDADVKASADVLRAAK